MAKKPTVQKETKKLSKLGTLLAKLPAGVTCQPDDFCMTNEDGSMFVDFAEGCYGLTMGGGSKEEENLRLCQEILAEVIAGK